MMTLATDSASDALLPRAFVLTANQPGAIGIIQVHGQPAQLEAVAQSLCGRALPDVGKMQLVNFADIDHGLLARISADALQLMPHGGLRIMQLLRAKLTEVGVTFPPPSQGGPRKQGVDETSLPPPSQGGGQGVGGTRGQSELSDTATPLPTSPLGGGRIQTLYPEARSPIEAAMLASLARAQSPGAIDLLLAQPQRWAAFESDPDAQWTADDEARSQRLNRLIDPPIVVLAGPANVGKSTLSNALLGRSMSIAIDMPGTTRDYTAGRIDLGGLVVWWHDTPGLRDSDDTIEQESIRIARDLMARADLLIALTDHEHPWPTLPREPDLRIANKADLLPADAARHDRAAHLDAADLSISATTGDGIADLVTCIRDTLVPPADIASERPWRFDGQHHYV